MSRYFGPALQNGYLIRDLDAAVEHWTQVLGIGPFFVIESVQMVEPQYRGKPLELDMSIALANSGDLQIELIRQNCDTPSIYREWLERDQLGLHHLGYFVDDIEAAMAQVPGGARYVQHGRTAGGGAFAYIETEAHPGTYAELIRCDDGMRGMFDMIRQASTDWDGSDPVRKLG